MPDPLDPQTYDETEILDGTIASVACEHVGKASVIIWVRDDAGATHQMNDRIETDAVATMGMLQLARDAYIHNSRVRVRFTEDGSTKWFHLLRLLD